MNPNINKKSEAAKKRCTPEWRKAVSRRQQGHEVSEETREKIRRAHKGAKFSEEHKANMSKARVGYRLLPETREKIRQALTGKKLTEEHKKNMSESRKGRKLSEEHKQNLSKALSGDKGPGWKGGLSNKNHLIRTSRKFRLWREEVFTRDDWICQDCRVRGCILHPHHILALSEHPEFAYDVDNGITLCVPCHRKRHGWKIKLNDIK